MAVVSDIEIRLRADIARLQQDMDRARREVSSTMSNITSVVKGAMGALAAIGGIAAFAGFIKSAIDATDAVSDISQRTGVAIKDIAGLQLWFQIGGAEAGEFESSMIKLSKAIATNGDAFKRIGVTTREANGALRSNVDVIRDSADALAKMQDGTAKTALAIELFGKSGATLIPILNSGSQGLQEMTEMAEKLGLTYDEKVVEQAGKFNDTLDFLGLAAQGVGRQVAAQLLPSLNSLAGSFLKFVTQSNAIKKACEAIVFGFKTVYTFGITVGTMFQTLGTIIGGTLAFITNNLSTIALGLKQAIEGDYSKAWATLTSGGKAAGAIVSATFNDIKTDISAAATTIGEVWTNSGGDAIEALAAMNKQSKYVSEEERKEMEKRAAAWAQYKRTLDESVAASAREAAGLEPLNAAQKALLDLTEDLRQGKIKLSAEQIKSAKQSIAEWEANIAEKKAKDALEKSSEALYEIKKKEDDARKEIIDKAREEAEANEKLVTTFGMTEAAIASLEVARLKEQLAQRSSLGLTLDEIEHLQQLIELKERSAKAVADKAQLEETKQFWTDIEKTAHDTFVSIADGGKNAFQRLKDTAKNVFFDWLYQQTLKKWIVNIQTNGTQGIMSSLSGAYSNAGGGVGGLFEAGKTIFAGFSQNLSKGLGETIMKFGSAFGSKAATSFGSSISSSASAGGIAGAIVAGMMANNKFYDQGWRIDAQVGDIISSQLKSMFKGNGFAPITAIMTASMASFEKILGGIGVNGKLASMLSGSAVFARAFGRKAPSLEAQGLQGTISASGFNGNLFADILEKGGWFRSDKRYTNTTALDGEQDKAFDKTIKGMVDSVRAFGMALGAETSVIDGYSKELKLTFTKDDAENQKMIAEAFAGIGDDLATRLIPNIESFNLGAETAAETLQRLAGEFTTTGALIEAMGLNVQTVFGTIGIASLEARDRLVRFAGGIDALAQQSTFFAQNFLTEAEQIAPLQRQVNEQLAALGYSSVSTADQFKAAVMGLANSGAVATAEGAKTYAGLLALAPAFKTVNDYLVDLEKTARDTEKQKADEAAAAAAVLAADRRQLEIEIMELSGNTIGALAARRDDELAAADAALRPLLLHIYALQDQKQAAEDATAALEENEGVLRGYVDAALSAVQRAVNAQKEVVTEAYQSAMEKLGASISRINDKIAQTSELSKFLQGSLIASPGDAAGVASRAAAQAQVTMALAVAKSSGILPSAESLKDALSVLNQDATDQFATLAEYQRSVARTNAEIGELGGLTDKQLSTAELQLQALEAQKSQAEQAYQAEIERLDSIVVWAQAQVDAINGVNNTTMSVVTAVASLQVALEGLRIGATPSNSSGRNLSVEDLYRTVLGREGEAAGIEYWKNVFGSLVDPDEYKAFIQGAVPELQMRQPPVVPDVSMSGRMNSVGAMSPDQQAFNQRMELMQAQQTSAIQRMSDQFNQVSGGGNSLLTEPA